MAYADARHTQRNLSTVAVVALLEAGLAAAVIAGLATNFNRTPPRPPVTTFDVPEPKIIPPETPPQTPPDTRFVPERPPVQDDRAFDLGPALPPFTGEIASTGEGEGIGAVAVPTPTPAPVPSFTPLKAKPRGNPASWVTTNDYPTIAIRGEQQGRTVFRVAVDAAGKVSGCTVTTSSGWPLLDAATCEKLTRRAKFEPAVDSTGAKTEGYYTGSVNWLLPED
jgi:periplasmic protein TonB